MAGRHRRPPAWRRMLSSLVRSRDQARTAALRAEVVALRATVTGLRAELAAVRAAAVVAAPVEESGWVTLRMPLIRLALGDPEGLGTGPDAAEALAAPDRSPDTAETEIVLEPSPTPADRLAWTVLAQLPERPLLDPRSDRDSELRDPATEATGTSDGRESAGHRRTA